jgi:anti-sigma regulatory factor (Ser/Thr protein kinase)/putative methionine-R-sulfoxide reductase with GAF domain
MITVLVIQGVALALQLLSAVLALRLIRVTGRLTAWLLLAAAISLIVARRLIAYVQLFALPPDQPPAIDQLIESGLLLAISTLLVAGIYAIEPIFLAYQRAQHELQNVNRTLRMLSSVNLALVRATSEEELALEACRVAVDIGGYRLAWIGYAEQDPEKTVRPVSYAGDGAAYLEGLRVSWADNEWGRGPIGTAVRTGQPVFFQNLKTDPRFQPWRDRALAQGYMSLIALPLAVNGKVIGALTLYSGTPSPFDTEEVKRLTEMADDLAYGITVLRIRKQHRQAEKALRASEEQKRAFYRKTIEAATEGKLVISEQDEITRMAGLPIASWTTLMIGNLGKVRQAVAEIVQAAGMDEERIFDFLVCISEAVTNACKHAGGGTLSLYNLEGVFLAVVVDHGAGIPALSLPELALKRGYTTGVSLGMGYKTMTALADKVYLATGPAGTMVAVEMALYAPPPQPALLSVVESW